MEEGNKNKRGRRETFFCGLIITRVHTHINIYRFFFIFAAFRVLYRRSSGACASCFMSHLCTYFILKKKLHHENTSGSAVMC